MGGPDRRLRTRASCLLLALAALAGGGSAVSLGPAAASTAAYDVLDISAFDLLVDPDRDRLYVTEPGSHRVLALSLPDLTVVGAHQFAARTGHLTTDPANQRLFVGLDADLVVVIRLADFAVVQEVSLPFAPSGLAVDGGNFLYAAHQCCTWQHPVVVNLDTGQTVGHLEVDHYGAALLLVDRDSTALYQGTMDTSPLSVVKYHLVDGWPVAMTHDHGEFGSFLSDMALSPDGHRLYLTQGSPYYVQVLDTQDFSLVGTADTGPYPSGVALNANGSRVYATHADSHVHRFDGTYLLEEAVYHVSPYEPTWMAVAEEHGALFARTEWGDLLRVDLTAPLGEEPSEEPPEDDPLPGDPPEEPPAPVLPLVTYVHSSGDFQVDLPEGWDVQWDYEVPGLGTVPVVALGPVEDGFQTNVLVAFEPAEVRADDASLREVADQVLREIEAEAFVSVLRSPTVVPTANARAALFEVYYMELNLVQVIALVAAPDQGGLWVVVGSVAFPVTNHYRPTFDAVVGSFRVAEAEAVAVHPALPYALVVTSMAGAAGLTVLLLRRREEAGPSTSTASLSPSPPSVPTLPSPWAPSTEAGHPAVLPTFCGSCGSRLGAPFRFCGQCGAPVPRSSRG